MVNQVKMYKNEDIQLYKGDCLQVMQDLIDKGVQVDMVLTDIPYGEVNRSTNGLRNLNKQKADIVTFDIVDLINKLFEICRGSFYVFCGIGQVSEIRSMMSNKGLSTRLCIWEKTNPSPMNGQNIWLSGVECCVYGKKEMLLLMSIVKIAYLDSQQKKVSCTPQ